MMVDDTSPPKITVASGLSISLPGSPPASISGISASAATSEVIRTGTILSWVAWRIVSAEKGLPSSLIN